MSAFEPNPDFTLQPKQEEALQIAKTAKHVLYSGGGRAGKSFIICYMILLRALHMPNSRHGIFRHTLKSCRQTLFDLTMREVFRAAYPKLLDSCAVNKAEATITLPNGSVIMFFGLDDDAKFDGILGHEFATIWCNECSLIPYRYISQLKGRLSQRVMTTTGKIGKTKFFYDQNPTGKKHWTHKLWIEREHPTTGLALEDGDEYAFLKMNPVDNSSNIAEDYIKVQMGEGRSHSKRFVDGDWASEIEGALFQLDWIRQTAPQFDHLTLKRIVVAIDPAATSTAGSDETGIVVVGISTEDELFVLEDASLRGTPQQWANRAAEAYDRWQADCIVVERNNGGEMVEEVMRGAGQFLPIKTVWASRGKTIRAEPVSNLYEKGKVFHAGSFPKLEEQMEVFTTDYNRTRNGSPDRLDALVWAISDLAVKIPETRGASTQTMANFWH